MAKARSGVRAAAVVLALALVTPLPANANGLAAGTKGGANYEGWKGSMQVRTDPPTITGIGFVHPTQVERSSDPADTDFVAIGTDNGAGISGTQCGDHYDPTWGIYVDWNIGTVYVCKSIVANYMGVGGAATWKIEWGYCSNTNSNQWLLWFASTLRQCVNATWHAGGQVVVALETFPTSTERNLDVRYYDLMQNLAGSTGWTAATKPLFEENPPTLAYTATYASGMFDIYLPPWE